MPWLVLALNAIHAFATFIYDHIRILTLVATLIAIRLAYLLIAPSEQRVKRGRDETCHLAVFLGSGGHTTEMLQLIGSLAPERYARRTYITSEGDKFSREKALERERQFAEHVAEKNKPNQHVAFLTLPRARKVHQTWLSTPLSVIVSFVYATYHVALLPRISKTRTSSKLFADLVLMNGPGTCVPLVMAVYVLRFFGLRSPRLMYVESFARVRSLSLTGKILRYFVDKFVVQWNENVVRGAHFQGWLV